MTELVDLIVADQLVIHLLLDILDVGLGGSDGRNSGAREGDLCGGAEFIYHIRSIAPLAAYYLNYQNSSWKTMVMLQG